MIHLLCTLAPYVVPVAIASGLLVIPTLWLCGVRALDAIGYAMIPPCLYFTAILAMAL